MESKPLHVLRNLGRKLLVVESENGIKKPCHTCDRVKLVAGLGFEPNKVSNKDGLNVTSTHQGTHQTSFPLDSALEKVVNAWEKLSPPLKAAILAIADSVEESK